MHATRPRRSRPRSQRRLVLALARLLFAVVLVTGITHVHSQYYYCEALGLSATDPCASAGCGEPEPGDAREWRSPKADCCEVIHLPNVPKCAQPRAPSVAPAAFVAVVPEPFARLNAGVKPNLRATSKRGREPPRSLQQSRAKSMVFLT